MRNLLMATGIVLALDRLSKFWVVDQLDLRSVGSIDVFPPFLRLRMAWNEGVNFGLFANDGNILRWGLIALAVIISVWLANWARKMTHWSGPLLAGLVIGGALGNALDRAIYGAVADFLNMSCCGLNNPFAFNIADVAIFLGAFGLVLTSNRHENSG